MMPEISMMRFESELNLASGYKSWSNVGRSKQQYWDLTIQPLEIYIYMYVCMYVCICLKFKQDAVVYSTQ